MGEYRCSNCGQRYTHREYMNLDTVSRVTDDSDDEYGVETVCECGKRFHSDKWRLVEVVDTPDGEIKVSTVALTIPHGADHDQWYETCLFHDSGSRVTDRYHNQSGAEDGHAERVEQIEAGDYSFKPMAHQIVVD